MKKFLLLFVTILSLGVFITGCGDTKDDNSSDEAVDADVDENEIDIADIPWSIEEGIVDGERYLLLNYTNNTDYTLTYFDIALKEKSSITEEEKASFYSDIQSAYEATDEEIEELKARPIAMHGDSEMLLKPGESASNIKCLYYEGYVYVKNINHYNLMEPDIATIKYVSNNNIYTVYYDYVSDKYTLDSEVEVAYYWTTSDLGTKIPKPDAVVVEEGADGDDYFSFDAYGISLEQFNAYVEECKGLGFTVEANEQNGYYEANDQEGYSISVNYDEDDASFDCSISAPEDLAVDNSEGIASDDSQSPNTTSSVSTDFKTKVDEYEAFFNKYVDICKRYNASGGTDMALATEYTSALAEYATKMAEFSEIEDDDLSASDLEYYTAANLRIIQKLAEIGA